jgi:hypothetical protein
MASKRGKTSAPAAPETASATVPSQPTWVKSAQEHFQRTGSYRPEDLFRLIGDPRESVEVSLTSDAELTCRSLKEA